jgi:hypothetical protein
VDEREQLIKAFMRDYGMTRAAAEQAVAIERGESQGDVIQTDEDGNDGTGQKQE